MAVKSVDLRVGGFCLVPEFHLGESTSNETTLFNLTKKLFSCVCC